MEAMENKQEYPNARAHKIISFVKSAVRIAGYMILPFSLVDAAVILIVSECIGIVEEMV